jgi:uncharacterized protein (TIGR02466 family)
MVAMERVNLFATPILSFADVGEAELDRELAGRLVVESEHGPGITGTGTGGGGWHSVADLSQRPEPCYQELMQRVVARVQASFVDVARDQDASVGRYRFAVQAWGRVLRHGDHALVHDHAEAHFAAIYYPFAGDADPAMYPDSGKLCFVDPRRGGTAIPGIELFPSQFAIAPRTGMLVVFPGWLQHFAQPYRGGRPRVSISCNVRLELDPEPAT